MATFCIVGLGNPGNTYVNTRHNVGFWLLDRLATQENLTFHSEPKFFAEMARWDKAADRYWLMKPTTFMNNSGQAVAALAHFYKLSTAQILTIHDDLDLPSGAVRLKKGGGAGGHNGLKSIISQLDNQFIRIRLGIGHPGQAREVVNYVLKPPSTEDKIAIEQAIDRVLTHLPAILSGDNRAFEKAMQALHTAHE